LSQNIIGTDREIRNARPAPGKSRTDYRVKGAPGLLLRVAANGTKTWSYVYKSPRTGKWAKVALGKYAMVDGVALAEAKGRASEVAADVRKGLDPIHDRRQEDLLETFSALAVRYMREHEKRNARGARQSTSTLEAQRQLDRDILPKLGRMRVEAITRLHVMEVVEAVADRGSYVAADRALGLIRSIYNWGCGTGRLDRNPTLGLKKRNSSRPKERVLSTDEIRAFWNAGESVEAITPALRDAMRLQLLTAARISEVLGCPRSELDLDRQLWTIAADRTKSGREHTLPLSEAAIAIFRSCIERADDEERRRAKRARRSPIPSSWVFPSPHTNGPIAGRAATRAIIRSRLELAEAGVASFNTHDLRRTAATQLGELEVAEEIIERVLNHAPRTVAGKHYNHARYLSPMRSALTAWSERLSNLVAMEQPSDH
jgi:integrase